ncbi:flagellar assembly peptidoglycan hydrolase FlgJ [Sulfuricystis multivorans]|uniref:flagellar assembly peptidoglycan hydrolase FlgJ n=1 Tax=Sulfuricystis multivorans TaxID=2211108 RepID=UPI000F816387|nr:flagellar assembly peptidoglycan hydrolase FlgJ [Sulfuricystis multivorans]
MNSATAIPSVFDAQALTAVKSGLRKDDPKALKAAAQQFEALFLQMVMKSMRAAVPQDGPFDSDQTRFYQELLDAQLVQVMAAKGGTGLAALIERQLSPAASPTAPLGEAGMPLAPQARPMPLAPQRGFPLLPPIAPTRALPLSGSPLRPAANEGMRSAVPQPTTRSESAPGGTSPIPPASAAFVSDIWPYAVEAGRTIGIPPQFIVAHAALESGWGRAMPRLPDGRPSYNLFGIKAGGQWQGPVVEAVTTEYIDGAPQRRSERFRAYGSYAEAFADYAQLLAGAPRYGHVLGSVSPVGFAQGLQRAGYASDPDYASKLLRVMRVLS